MPHTMTCLWMDNWIEEAVNFYVSLFPNSRVLDASRYPDSMGEMAGKPLVMNFELDGVRYMALNGGPVFKYTEAISIFVNCKDQAEVDRLWSALIANGGSESQCGWLKDRYGLSWQIVPVEMSDYIAGPDKAAANRAMQAMLKMSKIDLAAIKSAYAG
jgi:predicted 3-demethylubiquinone-9 3-methyltransferase (glyoxalase superfamily)